MKLYYVKCHTRITEIKLVDGFEFEVNNFYLCKVVRLDNWYVLINHKYYLIEENIQIKISDYTTIDIYSIYKSMFFEVFSKISRRSGVYIFGNDIANNFILSDHLTNKLIKLEVTSDGYNVVNMTSFLMTLDDIISANEVHIKTGWIKILSFKLYLSDKFFIFNESINQVVETIESDEVVVSEINYITSRYKEDIKDKEIKVEKISEKIIDFRRQKRSMVSIFPSVVMVFASFTINILNQNVESFSELDLKRLIMPFSMLVASILLPLCINFYYEIKMLVQKYIYNKSLVKFLSNQYLSVVNQKKFILDSKSFDFELCLLNELYQLNEFNSRFCEVVLGYDNYVIDNSYKYEINEFMNEKVLKLINQINNDLQIFSDYPITINLNESLKVAIKLDFLYLNIIDSIILQLLIRNNYHDVQFVLFCDEKFARRYTCLNPLYDDLYCYIVSKPNYNDLNNILLLLCEKKKVVALVLSEYIYNNVSNEIRKKISTLYFVDRIFSSPMEVESEVSILNEYVYYENMKFPFNCLTDNQINRAFYELSTVKLINNNSLHSLPLEISYKSLFSDYLNKESILDSWNTYKFDCKCDIGINNHSEVVSLDLDEKGDGPHGLIAGATGSGKSTLISNIILGLAMKYSPKELNYVIIDFKGGGLINQFCNSNYVLPHIVGTVKSIDDEFERCIYALQIECQKRQKMFDELSSKIEETITSFSSYNRRQKQINKDNIMARLVIIVDEFAELKKKYPEYMKEFISLSRIGRSYGIHLILATQKPSSSIDDEIWSNAKFKICMKVEEEIDSREVIHTSDALHLRSVGEFILLVNRVYEHAKTSSFENISYQNQIVKENEMFICEDTDDNSGVYIDHLPTIVQMIDELSNGFTQVRLWKKGLDIKEYLKIPTDKLLLGELDHIQLLDEKFQYFDFSSSCFYHAITSNESQRHLVINSMLSACSCINECKVYLIDNFVSNELKYRFFTKLKEADFNDNTVIIIEDIFTMLNYFNDDLEVSRILSRLKSKKILLISLSIYQQDISYRITEMYNYLLYMVKISKREMLSIYHCSTSLKLTNELQGYVLNDDLLYKIQLRQPFDEIILKNQIMSINTVENIMRNIDSSFLAVDIYSLEIISYPDDLEIECIKTNDNYEMFSSYSIKYLDKENIMFRKSDKPIYWKVNDINTVLNYVKMNKLVEIDIDFDLVVIEINKVRLCRCV